MAAANCCIFHILSDVRGRHLGAAFAMGGGVFGIEGWNVKILQKTDKQLELQAMPWVSAIMHGLLGLGFLVGFVISVWDASSLWLTLGMAICLAFILRIFMNSIESVHALLDRDSDEINVVRRSIKGRRAATYVLSDLSTIQIGHDRDGDADHITLHFGPDRSDLILPADGNGFFASSGQAEALLETINAWRATGSTPPA